MKEKLDSIFSTFIRKRDTPGQCISCGVPINFSNCDAGHYIPRKHMSTRWDEKNVHAQCIECNRFKEGNLSGYEKGLRTIYGNGIIMELMQKKNTLKKYSKTEIAELITQYKERTKIFE